MFLRNFHSHVLYLHAVVYQKAKFQIMHV